jgi:hypothetical protein
MSGGIPELFFLLALEFHQCVGMMEEIILTIGWFLREGVV